MHSAEHIIEPGVNMHFIEHIIEPTKLLLAWQSMDEKHRRRYIVAELHCIADDYTLTYLHNSKDFIEAQKHGFEYYPAFKEITKVHHNALDAFMRRLPPRKRGDFSEYLAGLRLSPDAQLSDFALLGYSGAKLLSDGFSIIHPFNDVDGPCELLIEAAGYKYRQKNSTILPQINSRATFSKVMYRPTQEDSYEEDAIAIDVEGSCIGYVYRGLIPTFLDWMKNGRIIGAWVEKTNGTSDKPTVYLYVQVSAK